MINAQNLLQQFKGKGPLQALDNSSITSPASLMFPTDELYDIDHWVTFRAFETTQLNRNQDPQRKALATIVLPMPANLNVGYNIGYSEDNLDAFGTVLADAFSRSGTSDESRQIVQGLGIGAAAGGLVAGLTGRSFTAGAIAGMTTGAVSSIAFNSQGQGTFGTSAVQAQIAKNLGDSAVGKAILTNSGGIAVNPHRVVLFEGVGFREHSFSYQLTPKSYEEAEMIRKIIYAFKYHSSPGFAKSININTSVVGGSDNLQSSTPGKFFFKYPEYFEIEFHRKEHLFSMAPSVLTRFNVDYHPLNTPAYSREEGREPTPVQINISLSFQETEIVTKESIEKGM